MPYTRILIHAVWATKSRKPYMNKMVKDQICDHIRDYCREKEIYLLNINGWKDHIHCLIALLPNQSLAGVMNLIKGESSYWVNKNLNLPFRFGWQDEYFAISVSDSLVKRVNSYINRQEQHHASESFEAEYQKFISKFETSILAKTLPRPSGRAKNKMN